MIYDLRFTIVRGAREFSGSAGILPACGVACNPETRRQDQPSLDYGATGAGAPGEQYFSISQSQ
jgi:hypothetical protein